VAAAQACQFSAPKPGFSYYFLLTIHEYPEFVTQDHRQGLRMYIEGIQSGAKEGAAGGA
jgi:hypothetical protein